jgi:hypothetical protein
VRIEILYFSGCPHHEATVARVREILQREGVSADIQETAVCDGEEADRLRFPGSPTVRIDGRDIEPAAEAGTSFALSCRMYGTAGVPPHELVCDAIRRARLTEA